MFAGFLEQIPFFSSRMKSLKFFLFSFFVLSGSITFAQEDSSATLKDSLNLVLLENYNKRLQEIERQRVEDSIKKEELSREISALKTTDNLKKEELQKQLLALRKKKTHDCEKKKHALIHLKIQLRAMRYTDFSMTPSFYSTQK